MGGGGGGGGGGGSHDYDERGSLGVRLQRTSKFELVRRTMSEKELMEDWESGLF